MGAPGRLELRLQLIPYQLMDGAIGKHDLMRTRQVLLNLSITPKAVAVVEPRLEGGQDAGRERGLFARRFFARS